MKVLSIKQPWASLICEGIKKYEIRSWKTNYRGELYIHSSMGRIPKKSEILNSFANMISEDIKYGYILGKCNLVDCVYIDKKFLLEMKKNAIEGLYGDDCIGYYAWVLKENKKNSS